MHTRVDVVSAKENRMSADGRLAAEPGAHCCDKQKKELVFLFKKLCLYIQSFAFVFVFVVLLLALSRFSLPSFCASSVPEAPLTICHGICGRPTWHKTGGIIV